MFFTDTQFVLRNTQFGLNPGLRTKARADLNADLNTVYDGETICEPNLTPDQLADRGLSVFMYSSDTKPAALCWEGRRGSATKRGKLFIGTAFMRIYYIWNTEAGGTSRYVLNIAASDRAR